MPITIGDSTDTRVGRVSASLGSFSADLDGTHVAPANRVGSMNPTIGGFTSSLIGQFGASASFDGDISAAIGGFSARLFGQVASTGVVAGTLAVDGAATPHQLALVHSGLSGLSQTATSVVRVRTASPVGAWSVPRPLHRVQPGNSPTPPWGAVEDVFAWPFTGLEPGTTYDVEHTKTLGATVDVDFYQFTTKSLPGEPGAVTTSIAASLTAGQRQTALNGASADAGANPIHVQFEAGNHDMTGVNIPASLSGASEANPSFITGASKSGTVLQVLGVEEAIIDLNSNISNLVIQDITGQGTGSEIPGQFDMSTWVYSPGGASVTNLTVRRTVCTGVSRGIYLRGANNQADEHSGVMIYDNEVTGVAQWQSSPLDYFYTNRAWDSYGVLMSGHGHAVFNNDFTGFGDMFSVTSGSTPDRSEQDRNQHFYRNRLRTILDDVMEVDDGYRNITFHDNEIRNTVNAGSCDILYGGPYVAFRNAYFNVLEARMFKHNSAGSGWFYYNNTICLTEQRYRSSRSQDNIALWYQPNNGSQNDVAFVNNWIGRVTGAAPDDTLRLNNFGYAPADIHNNSWYPDTGWQFPGGTTYSALSNLQSGQPAANGVFESFQRFENDTISVAQPFTSTITLGSNAEAEVTTEYGLTDVEPSHASLTNTGYPVPNITDSLTETYSGAAPARGANIPGLTVPVVGNRDSLPSWVPAVGEIGVIPSSNTAGQIIRADGGVPGYGGTDPDDIFTPWSGAGVITINGELYLAPYGGGHNDSAYNGIPIFGPIGSDSPAWSLHLGASAAGDVTAGPTYADGRQAAGHTYGAPVGVGDRLYVLATTEYVFSANSSANAYYFTSAGQTSVDSPPFVGANNARLACVYSEVDDRIYVAEANTVSNTLRYYNVTANTWGSVAGTIESMRLFSVMALDSSRNNLLYLSGAGNEGIFYDPDAGTVQASKNFPSNYFSNIVYDPVRDVYVHIPNNSTTIQELDASAINAAGGNPSWQNRVFTGAPPVGETGTGIGFYTRVQYISLTSTVGGYLVAPQIDSDVYFYRST